MSLELQESILVVIAILIMLIIYIIRRMTKAGRAIFDDPQIQEWLRKEQDLEQYGEWRADPEADLVWRDVDLEAMISKDQVGQAELVVIPHPQLPTFLELAPITQFINRELVWQLRYQNSRGCKRADLRPAKDGPTIAVLELLESHKKGAVAQVGKQGYVIYQSDRLSDQLELTTDDIPPDIAVLNGKAVTFGGGRAYRWRPAHTLYDPRAFIDASGNVMSVFHDGHLRITAAASPDIVPALILIEYYMYIHPLEG